ncbi:MAG: 3-phosphoshikimate 1-carboxyvinyltransferase [Candidatus Margulisiibacteriota bacterium]
MDLKILPCSKITGAITVPADKSISHRAVMLASLSDGACNVDNLLESDDCMRTVECFRAMGTLIEKNDSGRYLVRGRGLKGLTAPRDILYVGNSGTSIRLLLGILAGQHFSATITGDESIKQRPMKRVVDPLRKMGAVIRGRDNGNFAPLEIKGGELSAIDYDLPVASAQIKSCLMLSALFAKGATRITEPSASRDHTERMFGYFGIPFSKEGNILSISSPGSIKSRDLSIPGDISSASFFIVAALIVPGSLLLIKDVGLNPTRTGILDVLKKMGARIEIKDTRELFGELRGNIIVESSKLRGVDIRGDIIPKMIDEIPVLAVAAAYAEGTTIISDAQELKVKETNRIKTIAGELKKMGALVEEKEDGLIIDGGGGLMGAVCESHGDHRIAMSLAVAALAAEGETSVLNCDCISTSFPGFYGILKHITETGN